MVSAVWRFVPHLVQRQQLYAFPTPWQLTTDGVGDPERPDPAEVEWILLDLDALLDETHREVVDCIVAAGSFNEVLRDGPIVVLQRNRSAPDDAVCR